MKLTAFTLVVTVGGAIFPLAAASPVEPRLPNAGGIHRLTLLTPASKVDERLQSPTNLALRNLRIHKAGLEFQLSREMGASEASLLKRAELQHRISDLDHAIRELSPRSSPQP